jgi:tRNA pseudouridine synthase 10
MQPNNFKEPKVLEKASILLGKGYICDWCLGRGFAELLSGMTNEERGLTVRTFICFLLDSGEKIEISPENIMQIKFRNIKPAEASHSVQKCMVCDGFFPSKVEHFGAMVSKKMSGYEYKTFLVGTSVSPDLAKREENVWKEAGVDFVEPLKNEINREVGKVVQRITGKEFDAKDPDLTAILDLQNGSVSLQSKSVLIRGRYQKLSRGIPQTEWFCRECHGKGCVRCEGVGKMYKTSVQGIIESPLLKAAKAKASKFHGSGREDIDARCLGKRPFIIELVRPMVRSIDLKKRAKEINRSSKVKVFDLSFAAGREVDEVKSARHDKSYIAIVDFDDKIDRSKIKSLKQLKGQHIQQRTPQRVLHRRANLTRDRTVKDITAKAIGPKRMEIKVKGEAGLYIKELISGDAGRTRPNVSEILGNKVKSIKLDVIKIHD